MKNPFGLQKLSNLFSSSQPYIQLPDSNPTENQMPRRTQKRWFICGGILVVGLMLALTLGGSAGPGAKPGKDSPSHYTDYPVSIYANMTLLKTLDDVNGTLSELGNHRRLFVIGDVHGHLNALDQLISKIEYNPENDRIILAGDIVAKGPDSIGVIRRARELGALCVRGNHEDKVVRLKTFEIIKGSDSLKRKKGVIPEGSVADPLSLKSEHAEIARAMSREDYDYLVSCPVILDIPALHAVVVHAGLDPSRKELREQDPYVVMRVRRIQRNGRPTEEKKGEGWAELWNKLQAKIPQSDQRHVYYGHDASRGVLQLPYTTGLDSACARGRALTAIEVYSNSLTQVPCS